MAFTAMLIVPMLIPVLTDRPLPLSDMGDLLGGGFVLTLGSFAIVMAGLDAGNAYGGIGSGRSIMLSILAEPTLILVLIGISLLAQSMIPFVVNHTLIHVPAIYWSPAHVFIVIAFFALLLVETDRLPIHSSTHLEIYMIEEARILEYSGPLLALIKWARIGSFRNWHDFRGDEPGRFASASRIRQRVVYLSEFFRGTLGTTPGSRLALAVAGAGIALTAAVAFATFVKLFLNRAFGPSAGR